MDTEQTHEPRPLDTEPDYEAPRLTEVGGYGELTAAFGTYPLPDTAFMWN